MTIEVDATPTDYIPNIWGAVCPEIERALEHSDGEFNIVDIFSSLISGRMQLWTMHKGEEALAFAITSIEDYPQQRAARIILVAGGDLDDWLQYYVEKLERWATLCECDFIEWFGRPGWRKKASEYGYQRRYVVYRKRLTLEDKSKALH